MEPSIKHDYNQELDILHIYNQNIDNGIKGCLTYGNFNIDVGQDDKIVGIEIEGASSVFNLSSETLSNLDNANIIVRKHGNSLLIGAGVVKGEQKSMIQVTPSLQQETPLTISD